MIGDGVLFQQWESTDGSKIVYQLVMPKSECENVLWDLHERAAGCHLGSPNYLKSSKRVSIPGPDMPEM